MSAYGYCVQIARARTEDIRTHLREWTNKPPFYSITDVFGVFFIRFLTFFTSGTLDESIRL